MLAKLDRDFYLWCNQFQQSPEVIAIFRFISRTGDGQLYVAIAILLYLIDGQHQHSFVHTGLIAFAIEIPSFLLLKQFIKRDRPAVSIPIAKQAFEPTGKFSLPSGHSAAAFAMAILVAIFYPDYASIVLTWASLIAVSRVMLGVHYATDIIAGAILGSSCTYLAIHLKGIL